MAVLLLSIAGARLEVRLGVPHLFRLARSRVYCAAREWQKARTLRTLDTWLVTRTGNVVLHFTPGDAGIAPAVARYAADTYTSVSDAYDGRSLPREVHVALLPSFEAMAELIPGSGSERSVGVYWAGVVGVVSPAAWGDMFGEGQPLELFRRYNPLNHELTHLALDYAAGGNYPLWFSEGIAQIREYETTGYSWVNTVSTGDPAVSVIAVERAFRSEETLGAAYRGSMDLSRVVLDRLGAGGLGRLATFLRSGYGFEQAVDLAAATASAQAITQDKASPLLKERPQR
ncbi:MAG: hypothetical protein HPY55_04045 [Firmicutes bacterium]|nr:hypothetical protein [Bacillota bacterium]